MNKTIRKYIQEVFKKNLKNAVTVNNILQLL